jgi:DNA primase
VTIPADKIEEVRSRASIVEVVSEFVNLKRSGRGYTGLCPFHHEKTPSFHVDDEKQLFHCFGCSKGGSIFDFVEQMKGLTFPEAVRLLASRYGITIEETQRGPAENRDARIRRSMVETLREAEKLFGEILLSGPAGAPGREYLKQRGITPQSVANFRLGFAPQRWDLIADELIPRLKQEGKGFPLEEDKLFRLLLSAGLIKRRQSKQSDGEDGSHREDAGYYDFFRDRLIFPITRSDGVTVAFTGRALKNGEGIPKYLNTPETPLFSKRRTFFGLSQALAHLRKSRRAILVEGNVDVISLVQAGFTETIATCGTAVTLDHIGVLKRLVSQVTVIFDGDSAGRKAAASCFELFRNSGIEVLSVSLDPGEDPDSLCRRSSGKDEIEKLIASRSRPLVENFVEFCLVEAGGPDDPGGASSGTKIGNAASKFARAVAGVENPVEREVLLRAGANKLGISEKSLEDLLHQVVEKSSKMRSFSAPRQESAPASRLSSPPPYDGPVDSSVDAGFSEGGFFEAGLSEAGINHSYPPSGFSGQYGSGQYGGPTQGQYNSSYSKKRYGDSSYGQNRGSKFKGGFKKGQGWADKKFGRQSDSDETLVSETLPREAYNKADLKKRFLDQVIVSVVREPGIARTILDSDTFLQSGTMTPEAGRFLASVVRRLEGSDEFELPASGPLFGLSIKFSDEDERERTVKSWRGLLKTAGLDPEAYITEAFRQTQVGGAQPEAIMEGITADSTRFSLRKQVEGLREKEQEVSADNKLDLIQEKLLKRRSIERLRKSE